VAKKKGGRVTPKGTAPRPRRPSGPRPDADRPLGQVGRRPTNPAFLLLVALAWIGAGVVALVAFHAGWKLVPVIVFFGLGLLYLRAAGTAYLRQTGR
jgi:hypothetical protein